LIAYVTRRLLFGLFIIWGVYTLTFFLVNLAPGDPFLIDPGDPRFDRAAMERERERWGYDRPIHERYLVQLRGLFWSAPEVYRYESRNFEIEVFGGLNGNLVRVLRRRDNGPRIAEFVGSHGQSRELAVHTNGDPARHAIPPGRYSCDGALVWVREKPLDRGGIGFYLGFSISRLEPITRFLATPILNTLLLTTAALLIDFVLGILIGVISARRAGSRLDRTLSFSTLVVYSLPGFWLALVLVFLLGVRWKLLPTAGVNTPGYDWTTSFAGFVDGVEHLILPAFVLGITGAAATARFQRSSMIEVLRSDFIRTAWAKGLSSDEVIWRHAFRNSLAPILTLVGLSLPFLVSGSVIIESIFSWPGMGRELVEAVRARDDLLVTAITLLAAVFVVLGNLLADLAYAFVDPRVRLS